MMDFSLPQRQSIAALLNIIVRTTKTTLGWAWFIYASILLKQNNDQPKEGTGYILWGTVIILVFIITRSIIEWLRFTFYIQQEQLIVNKGIFTKNQMIIPIEKIQTVHIEQHIWHRMTATCKLIIDTAGTNKEELTIHALPTKTAAAIKTLLLQEKQSDTHFQTPNNQTIISLSFTDLLKLSFTANHLETFVIIFFFTIGKLDDLGKLFHFSSTDWIIEKSMEQQQANYSWQLISTGIAIVLLFSVAASIIRMAIKYYHFTISLSTKGFEASWGLIQHKQEIIPIHKIQFIAWKSNWIRRKLGLYLLHLKAVGEDELKKNQKIQIPITQLAQLQTMIKHYQANIPSQINTNINTVHRSFFWRMYILFQLPFLVITGGVLFFWIEWKALLLIIIAVYWLIAGLYKLKNFQYWITESAVEIQTGVWGRNYTVLNWKKIQLVSIAQSLYQKRKQLATLEMHTASGTIKLPYIDVEKAYFLADYITMQIEMKEEVQEQNQENNTNVSQLIP